MRNIALFAVASLAVGLTSCHSRASRPKESAAFDSSGNVQATNGSIAICDSVNNSTLKTAGSIKTNISKNCNSKNRSVEVKASNGGVAIGGSVNGSTITAN